MKEREKNRTRVRVARGWGKVRVLSRKCNVCGKPVRHYLDDARTCFSCRADVLAVTDPLGYGAVGDPGMVGDWCMSEELRGLGESWTEECRVYLEE